MSKRFAALALAAFVVSACAPASVGAAQTTAPQSTGQQASAPQAPSVPQAGSCSGVWVVVDFGSIGGGTSTACATDYTTGLAALRSAGFSPEVGDGFVYKLKGKPSKPDINKAYWSYWHATEQSDGGWSSWSYSNLGASSSKPKPGTAEGWHYVSISDGNSGPGAKPPAASASPSPTPSKSTTKPTTKPSSSTSTPKSSSSPTRTANRTASSTATASASAKASSKASATPKATSIPASPSSTEGAATSEVPTNDPAGTETDVAVQQPSATAAAGGDAGSPVGALVVGSVVVLAGGGLGGWWLLKGRKP